MNDPKIQDPYARRKLSGPNHDDLQPVTHEVFIARGPDCEQLGGMSVSVEELASARFNLKNHVIEHLREQFPKVTHISRARRTLTGNQIGPTLMVWQKASM